MECENTIWLYPKEKRIIKKEIMNCVNKNNNVDYVLDRIGYFLYSKEPVPDYIPEIKKAVDTILKLKISVSTTRMIFEYVANLLLIKYNT